MRSSLVGAAVTIGALATSFARPTTASTHNGTFDATSQLSALGRSRSNQVFERGRSPGSGGGRTTAIYIAPAPTTMSTSTTVKAGATTSTKTPEASKTAEPYLQTAASLWYDAASGNGTCQFQDENKTRAKSLIDRRNETDSDAFAWGPKVGESISQLTQESECNYGKDQMESLERAGTEMKSNNTETISQFRYLVGEQVQSTDAGDEEVPPKTGAGNTNDWQSAGSVAAGFLFLGMAAAV